MPSHVEWIQLICPQNTNGRPGLLVTGGFPVLTLFSLLAQVWPQARRRSLGQDVLGKGINGGHYWPGLRDQPEAPARLHKAPERPEPSGGDSEPAVEATAHSPTPGWGGRIGC